MASTTTSPPPAGGTTSNTNCSACGSAAPRPHLTCFECADGVDIQGAVSPIQYCTVRCRDVAATEHKGNCGKRITRTKVYRAGQLLQSAFYRSSSLNFLIKITQVYKSEDVLYFHQAELEERTTVFETSPYRVTQNANDAHAIMSGVEGEFALALQFELSKKLLSGIAKYIEEVTIDNTGVTLKAKLYPGCEFLRAAGKHTVLCIQTHADESYIIDVTGARYGQPKAVLCLGEALSFYGRQVMLMWPHGHHSCQQLASIEEELAGDTILVPRDRIIPVYLATLFNKQLDSWERTQNIQVCDLLKSKQDYKFLETTIDGLIVDSSVQGRAVLRKSPPAKVIPLIEVANNDQGKLNQPVLSTLSKVYTGSDVGKFCYEYHMWMEKCADPERWRTVFQPMLANNGSIILNFEHTNAGREALKILERGGGNPVVSAMLAKSKKLADFWTFEALAN
ncbi:hypothetical protein CKM354_001089500 [Cercospora kikuchii]|uniref:Suppressor of anucleate metulae protein B n=1 Tax=Cercospora kikuchii TaxID=84275 RepID=A0A9P3CRW2_9PEZI|nr:uncharacterized protein CKM354_001089500 [Cercospora kikuchii]GIZ47813.1 hypothetical protein CKM354_001089500 [Cercospora kikuchii]